MDSITLAIITALANLSSTVINDAYQAFKTVLQLKYGVDSDLVEAVEKLEERPESEARKNVLQEEVAVVVAYKDHDIRKAADLLIEAIKAQPGGEKVVQQMIDQNIKGDHNIFSGSGDVTVTR